MNCQCDEVGGESQRRRLRLPHWNAVQVATWAAIAKTAAANNGDGGGCSLCGVHCDVHACGVHGVPELLLPVCSGQYEHQDASCETQGHVQGHFIGKFFSAKGQYPAAWCRVPVSVDGTELVLTYVIGP